MHVRKLDLSIDALVTALCLDYKRREEAIYARSATKRTDTEYRYLNFKIYDAVAEISGERDAMTFISEIGNKTGYAKSALYYLSEATYKNYKMLIKENVAKKLHLID